MFSQTVEYALRAMVLLASRDGESTSSERIARTTRVPPGYLSKVMRDLVVAGLASSQRGPSGGFTLARPADDISILDIVNAVDPIRRITSCPLGDPLHARLCPLHRRLDDALAHVQKTLGGTTLGEIVRSAVKSERPRGTGRRCGALISPAARVTARRRGRGRAPGRSA